MNNGDKLINMSKMKYIFSLSFVFVLISIIGCQEPEELLPSVARDGINSITATFEDGTGSFIGKLTEESNEIVIPIPYYYPENSDNQVTKDQMSKMRVRANLDDNVTVSPSLLFMDLTNTNVITVTNQKKEVKEYIVRGEIRKSDKALIEEFSLPELGLTGVINEGEKTIALVAIDDLEPTLAKIKLSAHASVSPDPTTEALDYNEDVTLTVTAHDGVTKTVYTISKEIPLKLPFGIRAGSAKLMFAKRLNADLGISTANLTGGIAATEDYVVLNTRNANSIYLNAKDRKSVV